MRRFCRDRSLAFLAGIVAFVSVSALPQSLQAGGWICGRDWQVVPSPNVGTITSELTDVAAIGSTNAWAVGFYFEASDLGLVSRTLVERWDGKAWSVVSSPNGLDSDDLTGIAAVSPSDIWAVGRQIDLSPEVNTSYTLVEHWDGLAWTIIPSPNVGMGSNALWDVAATSSSDVWAVGDHVGADGVGRTLALHWNGLAWSVVPTPTVGTHAAVLTSLTAISPSNVWAAGYFSDSGSPTKTLVEHWNGRRWRIVPSPNPGSGNNQLLSIDATSPRNVWAVGDFIDLGANQTLTEQWSGRRWRVVPSPNASSGSNVLMAVETTSVVSAWAVGFYIDAGAFNLLTERWNGSSWTIVQAVAPPGAMYPVFLGVTTDDAGNSWAVGTYYDGVASLTLAECINPT